jgi:hypothetical protein
MSRVGHRATLFLLCCAVSAPGFSRSIAYDEWSPGSLTSGTSVTLPTSSACGGNVVLGFAVESSSQSFCLAGFTSLQFSPGYTATVNSYTQYQTFVPGASVYQSGYASAYVWDPGASFTGGTTQTLPAFTSFQFAPDGLAPDPPPNSPANLAGVLLTPYTAQGSTGFTIAFDYVQTSKGANGALVVTNLATCAGAPATFTVNGTTYSAADPCKSGGVAFDFLKGSFHDSIAGGLLGSSGNGEPNAPQSVLPAGWSCSGPGCAASAVAPEIDAASAASALTLLFALIAVQRARKRA